MLIFFPLGRLNFARLIELLNYPRITFGDLVIEAGREPWLRFDSTPPQRKAALLSLGDVLMTITEGGRARQELYRNHEAIHVPEPDVRTYVRESIAAFGDLSLLEVFVEGLTRAPGVVRAAALAEVAFLSLGRESRAWTMSARLLDRQERPLHRLILFGPKTDVDLVLHEVSHVWHYARLPREDAVQPSATLMQGERDYKTHATEAGFLDRMNADTDFHERVADACARLWSFNDKP